jgi:MYXO-CTERM domain-containing protein
MRLSYSFLVAAALCAAAPALAQNSGTPTNTTDMTSGNTVSTSGVDANSAAGGPATPTDAAATPGTQQTALPPTVTTPAETGSGVIVGKQKGFPWGVLGLLGLLGILGKRRRKEV